MLDEAGPKTIRIGFCPCPVAADTAIDVLMEIAQNSRFAPMARTLAAKALLESAVRLVEANDTQQRLAASKSRWQTRGRPSTPRLGLSLFATPPDRSADALVIRVLSVYHAPQMTRTGARFGSELASRGILAMNETLIISVLIALAIVAIGVLIIMYTSLRSKMRRKEEEYSKVQSELAASGKEFRDLQSNFHGQVQLQLQSYIEKQRSEDREQLEKVIMEQARNAFQSWQMSTEANIRSDAIRRSTSVVTGQVTEHLTPYLGTFPYNPKDARFLGAPVDLIIFDGMSNDDLQQIIFLEVKTNAATLSARERRIRDTIRAGRVTWQEFRVTRSEGSPS